MAKVETMKECEQVRLLLIPYLDGEATREEKAWLLSHVGACPSCAGDLEAHKRIGSLMAALCAPKGAPRYSLPDEPFAERVRAKAHARSRNLRLALRGLQAAAIVLLALSILSWLGKPESNSRVAGLKPEDELIRNLDILEELDDAGLEPTRDLVKLLADIPKDQGESRVDPRNGDPLDTSLFDHVLEEELAPEKS
jgi:hypothetical protein